MSAASLSSSSSPPPLTFRHSSPAMSTSGEPAAPAPVGGIAAFPLRHHDQQQQQRQDLLHHHPQLHTSVIAHPRLHLNTTLAVGDDADYYAHGHHQRHNHQQQQQQQQQQRHDGAADRASLMIADDLMVPVCNFEAFAQHFHLPLKAAAEKFGVRATAFKKRCRSIGIRHWPYRKVRSLRRSLQELDRCQEQGTLNDKQQHQLVTFTKQLNKLLSPETYGIDPSGRIPQQHFEDSEDESDDNESCRSSTQSPRYGTAFSDCNISPTDGDRTFGDFCVATPPPHMRILRNKHSIQYMQEASYPRNLMQHFSPDLHPHPLQRLQAPKDAMGLFPKFSFGMLDPYAHEAQTTSSSRVTMASGGIGASRAHAASEREDMSSQPSNGMEASSHNLQPGTEDVRSLNEADDEFTDSAGPMDYTNERFFDDVFLQISPDYGCLV